MKILILEDEIPAYNKLTSYLNEVFNNEIKHDWARSNSEGKDLILKNTYDFILSDIQLLDGISFDLFEETTINCPIIFCSAHDEYLFKAFNTNGIAYILKPYTKSDFSKAIEKYQTLFKKGNYTNLNNNTITELKSVLKEENFCIATDFKGKRHTISLNLGNISKQLNSEKFFKINRSEIIQIDYINNIESHFKNRLLITIKGVKEKVMTSSSTTAGFRKWLES